MATSKPYNTENTFRPFALLPFIHQQTMVNTVKEKTQIPFTVIEDTKIGSLKWPPVSWVLFSLKPKLYPPRRVVFE